jgi:hypothetical protein
MDLCGDHVTGHGWHLCFPAVGMMASLQGLHIVWPPILSSKPCQSDGRSDFDPLLFGLTLRESNQQYMKMDALNWKDDSDLFNTEGNGSHYSLKVRPLHKPKAVLLIVMADGDHQGGYSSFDDEDDYELEYNGMIVDISGVLINPDVNNILIQTDLSGDLNSDLSSDLTSSDYTQSIEQALLNILDAQIQHSDSHTLTQTPTHQGTRHPSILWADRCKEPPAEGVIRLLTEPDPSKPWSDRDFTFGQWMTLISSNEEAAPIFYENQRLRCLAKAAMNKWRHTIWMRRTQCNIDMIDMAPVPDRDAVFICDTTNRTVFRFHRRDIFNNLLSNICLSDEMMPTPRVPTNPWTNQPLRITQIMSVCEQLIEDYGRKKRCPPVLFAAFCASRYDVDRFQLENSSLLAHHAIVSYYKDLTPENGSVVEDTMITLLNDAQLDYSPNAIRRWLQSRPVTPLHREWLTFVQDYTLYMNLHVQVRPRWINRAYIRRDVADLYGRTTIPTPARRRPLNLLPGTNLMTRLLMAPAEPRQDASGNPIPPLIQFSAADNDLALQIIQNALFRF